MKLTMKFKAKNKDAKRKVANYNLISPKANSEQFKKTSELIAALQENKEMAVYRVTEELIEA